MRAHEAEDGYRRARHGLLGVGVEGGSVALLAKVVRQPGVHRLLAGIRPGDERQGDGDGIRGQHGMVADARVEHLQVRGRHVLLLDEDLDHGVERNERLHARVVHRPRRAEERGVVAQTGHRGVDDEELAVCAVTQSEKSVVLE